MAKASFELFGAGDRCGSLAWRAEGLAAISQEAALLTIPVPGFLSLALVVQLLATR